MDLNWLECLLIGLFAGFTDVLPVSAQAHKAIFLKIFGANGEPPLLRLAIHVAIFGMLYYCSMTNLKRLNRALRLARIPKKRRKRPLDSRTVAEFKVLRTLLIPVILAIVAYSKVYTLSGRLNLVAVFLLLNGVILYLPKLMPTGNKDPLSMSALDSLLIGFGSIVASLPGVSNVGVMLSMASICGTERRFALNLAYLAHLVVLIGAIFVDLIAVFNGNVVFSIPVFVCCAAAALAAAVGTYFGVRVMRLLADHNGISDFAYYSFGAALFAFILYLMV